MKKCRKCGEQKPHGEFHRNKAAPDGLQYYCKACQRISVNPEVRRRWHLKNRYGITVEQYDEMYERQGGRCAICSAESPGRTFDVDHDHDTGEVRGLLCNPCNRAIGLLGHDHDLLMSAIQYLEQSP